MMCDSYGEDISRVGEFSSKGKRRGRRDFWYLRGFIFLLYMGLFFRLGLEEGKGVWVGYLGLFLANI